MKATDKNGGRKNEKGFVLILALVTMVSMTVIGISLVMNMNVDMQLSRNEREAKQAFQLAEAGIQETVARLHLPSSGLTSARYIGEDPGAGDYRTTGFSRTFNYDAGHIGPIGTGTNTYSVTVEYLTEQGNTEGFCDDNNGSDPVNGMNNGDAYDPVTNPGGGASVPPTGCVTGTNEIVFYGQDFNISAEVTKTTYGILPVYRVTSTGTANSVTRQVVTYIGASTLNTDPGSVLNTNGCIADNGATGTPDTYCRDTTCGNSICGTVKPSDTVMDEYLGDNIDNIVASADLKLSCATQAECNAVIDSTVDADWGDYSTDTYSVMVYIKNTSGAAINITGLDLGPDNGGRGILIVDGPLALSGNFKWEGLVYVVNGGLSLGGGGSAVNITGGMMAEGDTALNGSALTLNYDLSTLQEVARQSSSSAVLLWKRL